MDKKIRKSSRRGGKNKCCTASNISGTSISENLKAPAKSWLPFWCIQLKKCKHTFWPGNSYLHWCVQVLGGDMVLYFYLTESPGARWTGLGIQIMAWWGVIGSCHVVWPTAATVHFHARAWLTAPVPSARLEYSNSLMVQRLSVPLEHSSTL